jgi:Ca2+-binding RTX toxin-like protein
MVNINLGQLGSVLQYTGTDATSDLFGANFLFSRDGAWQPGEVSRAYQGFARETGLSTLRYPGGTMSEESFDMANPNSMGDTSEGKKGLVPLSNFLEYAASIGATATIVIPTYRLFSDQFDNNGLRIIDQGAEAKVREFIQFALKEASDAGTKIEGFELGNEWWVNNTEIFGFRMTPIEYGRIANFLAKILQEEIDEYNSSAADWNEMDPDIVIQVGPGGDAEWYSRAELGMSERSADNEISATEVIFLQITDIASRSAIDGILTHRYLKGTDEAISGWAYNPFSRWENLAQAAVGFKDDFRKYVTEWNVSARNETEIGLKQFDSMVLLAREMMTAGVTTANVWAVQQNNQTKLIYNTGTKDAPYGGLTFGGTAFDMMATQLPGLRVIENSGALAGLQCIMFGSDSRLVYFLTNKTGFSRNDYITKSTVPTGTTHVSVYEVTIGSEGRPTVTVRTYSMLELPSSLPLSLSVDENVMVVFAKGGSGVSIEGYDLADSLIGTAQSDSITGGLLSDTISGSGGSDTILGESGSDLLFGGDGNDILVGGIDSDLMYGGSGEDFIFGGLGADTIFGGTGNDTLSLESVLQNILFDLEDTAPILLLSIGLVVGEFENLIAGDGHDAIFGSNLGNEIIGMGGDDDIDGRGGDDTLGGDRGNDVVAGGTGSDRISGGTGDDLLRGDEGDDLLVGGDGDDLLFGGSGGDVLEGNNGDDVVNGDDGFDLLMAGSGNDTVLGGCGDDRTFGGAGNDLLYCEEGDDYGNGGEGDDLIFGGLGADSLAGSDGDDILLSGAPLNVPAWLARGIYNVETRYASLDAILDEVRGHSLSTDREYVSGGVGNDILFGGAGSDKLFGDAGDDWIFSFGGQDTLAGGFGEDVFVLSCDAVGRTIVSDFRNDVDSLFLSGYFGDDELWTDSFVERFSCEVADGVLLDFRNGTEILLVGLRDAASLHDDLTLL